MKLRLLLAIVPVVAILGQPSRQSGQYKLVNLKPNRDDAPFAVLNIPPGPLKLRGVTLKKLIMDAYGVPGFQIAGGPRWVSTDRWDFEAQTDGPGPMATEPRRRMLVKLLEDCFQLRVHRETRAMPVYELTMASNGPNLKNDPWLDARGPLIKDGVGSIHLRNSSLAELSRRLALHLGRPVFDTTGTTELFSISLDWAPEPGEDGGPEAAGLPPGTPMPKTNTTGPPILQALREQLGLRLLQRQGSVEVIVIDEAETPRRH